MSSSTKCTSSSISLEWSIQKSTDESEIDGYTVKYRIKGTKRFSIKQIDDPSEHYVLLDGLKSDTEYEIKVYCSVDGDESMLFEKNERTEKSISSLFMQLAIKPESTDDIHDIYQLVPENIQVLENNVRYCDMRKF